MPIRQPSGCLIFYCRHVSHQILSNKKRSTWLRLKSSECRKRAFGKQETVVIIARTIKQHLLGVFDVLPHRLTRRLWVALDQRFDDFIVLAAPTANLVVFDVFVQLLPVRVVLAMFAQHLCHMHNRRVSAYNGQAECEIRCPSRNRG